MMTAQFKVSEFHAPVRARPASRGVHGQYTTQRAPRTSARTIFRVVSTRRGQRLLSTSALAERQHRARRLPNDLLGRLFEDRQIGRAAPSNADRDEVAMVLVCQAQNFLVAGFPCVIIVSTVQ